MEKSYLIYRAHPFFTNKKKEIVKQPKIYFVDTGLRNVIAQNFDVKIDGKLFENYVLTELLKMDLTPKYWRTKTKTEVDFIVEKDNNIIPIEVKIQATVGKIEKSLRAFIEHYHPKKAVIISATGTKGEAIINSRINTISNFNLSTAGFFRIKDQFLQINRKSDHSGINEI